MTQKVPIMKKLDLPTTPAPNPTLGSMLRRGLLPLLALLFCGMTANAQDPFTISGTVHRDNNGTNNGMIDGPVINRVGSTRLYVYLIDGNDSVVDAAPVGEDGTFQVQGIAFRSYNISLSAAVNPINSVHPLIVLPTAWVPTAEGEITPTSVNGDGYADLGIAVNASDDIIVRFGINQRPVGNPYTITDDVRDAFNQNYITYQAFSGMDPEDGPFTTGLIGGHIDLFRANGGILFYNGVAVTASTTAAGTRFSNFDTSKLRYFLLPWLPHNFAYSLVDSAGTPQYVPSIVTMAVALPVDLLSFTGYTSQGINILEWSTASERVNSGFILERSADGANFEEVGQVPSQALYGSSNTTHNYSFRDNTVRNDVPFYYYRLRQTDVDGSVAYSKIIKLTAGNGGTRGNNAPLNTYPNPSTGALMIDWSTGIDEYQVAVRNSAGTLVLSQSLSGSGGTLHSKLDLGNLPPGNYFISLKAGELQQSRQITLMTR